MKTAINLVLFGLLSLGTSTLHAQDLLRLEQALRETLDHNFDIQLAENQVKVSEYNSFAANANMLPRLDAVANTNDNFSNTSQTLSDGTQQNLDRSKNNSLTYGLALNWTLFDGFKMFSRYQELKKTQDQSQKRLQLQVLEKVHQVYTVYYDLVQQQKLLTALDSAVVVSQQRIHLAENRYQIGKASKLEVLNAQVDLNTDITNLTKQKEFFHNGKIQLNRIMARRDILSDFSVAAEVDINWDLELVDLLLQLDSQNPELQLALVDAEIAQLQYKQIRADRYPTLQLNSGYNFSETESSLGFVSQSNSRGWNYGLSARINLFNGNAQNQREKIAHLAWDNAQLIVARQKQSIEADLMMAYQTYTTNLKLVSLEGKNEEIAKENLSITLDKFEIGTIPTLEFRTAQLNYLNAVVRNNNAQYQAKLSEIILKVLVGKMDI